MHTDLRSISFTTSDVIALPTFLLTRQISLKLSDGLGWLIDRFPTFSLFLTRTTYHMLSALQAALQVHRNVHVYTVVTGRHRYL
jgi:hypothetical protein